MALSVCYVLFQRVLQLIVLGFRSRRGKDVEILVLRHELAILRGRSRPFHVRGSCLPGGRQPAGPARGLGLLSRHAGDVARVASGVGGSALDLSPSCRAHTQRS